MSRTGWAAGVMLLLLTMLSSCASSSAAAGEGGQEQFQVPADHFSSTGRNDYFILEPGYRLTLESADAAERLIITVLDETKTIDGVQTRIVEERESADGKLVEVSRNYFAINRITGDAYYFGEDVDIYKNGKITSHEGGWQAGKDGAHYGLFMPAHPAVGQKFYQEVAPKVAMDRAQVVSLSEKITVPAGNFEHCLKTEETTPLEPGEKEHKLYAPGVGLLIDGDTRLVKYGQK